MALWHDVAEYIHEDVPHPPFFIQNLLPMGGSMLLYGMAGEMKSFLAMYMGFCIATGNPWLDFPTTQGKVLLMNFEISEALYHDRLVNMSRHYTLEGGKFYVSSIGAKFLNEDANFNWFMREFVEPIDPSVVILDCLAKCYGGDENSNQELGRFFAKVDILKGQTRGVVIIHHDNKNLMIVDSLNKARGGTRLVGDPDTVIHLGKQPVGKQIQFGKTRLSTMQLHSKNIIFDDYIWRVR